MREQPLALVLSRHRTAAEHSSHRRNDDHEINADVLQHLWYRSDLDPDDLRWVGAETHDGVVHLIGTTTTEQARAAIEVVARRVRGVLGVRNTLHSFEALAAAAQPSGEPVLAGAVRDAH